MIYKVSKAAPDFNFDDSWQQGQWSQTTALEVATHIRDKPEHFPETQAKLLYDDKNIYVFFTVKDKYVRSVADTHQGNVWQDSCVEFFFTPGNDISQGYFNVEANCGGFILIHYQTAPDENRQIIDISDIDNMTIEHSMPRIVEPEIPEPTAWTLKYAIPFTLIEKYSSLTKPDTGVQWKANFYKCADKTSHPHWLTWSTVKHPKPNFHLPQYFGTIEFE